MSVHLPNLADNWRFLAGAPPYQLDGYPALSGHRVPPYELAKDFSGFFGVTPQSFSNYQNRDDPHAAPLALELAIALRYGFAPDAAFREAHKGLDAWDLHRLWFDLHWKGWRGVDHAADFRQAIRERLASGGIMPLQEDDPALRSAIAAVQIYVANRGRGAALGRSRLQKHARHALAQGQDGSKANQGLNLAARCAAWTAREAAMLARTLVAADIKILYICGAPRSGKSLLIRELGECFQAESPSLARVFLNVRDLVHRFKGNRDAPALHAWILEEVASQLKLPRRNHLHLQKHYDFDREMEGIVGRWTRGSVHLYIAAADACLRLTDGTFRQQATDAIKPLFSFLRPMAQSSGKPVFEHLSVVVEGSRPLNDLADAYDGSPLNFATNHILGRFDALTLAELCELAGFGGGKEVNRLQNATGGHRSLVWGALRSVADQPGAALPEDFLTLPGVSGNLKELLAELHRQPDLQNAMARALQGQPISLEDRTRLSDAMYLAEAGEGCVCPLLEGALAGIGVP